MPHALVGRHHELLRLLDACSSGRPGVVIEGDAGVGKSRLVDEATRQLASDGWRVVRIVGSDATRNFPFAPLASLLPLDPPADRAVLAAHVLRGILGDRSDQLLVNVDDAHLLDDATLGLLVELVVNTPAVVTMTVRADEFQPPTLAALARLDDMVNLHLEPMPPDDIAELAALLLGGPIEIETGRRLADACGGNPLLLREMVADARSADRLQRGEDSWRLVGELAVGRRLTPLVQARLEDLEPRGRELLERIAVAEPLEMELVGSFGSDALGDLERRSLATVESVAGRWYVRTDHPIIGEVVRNDMTVSHRRVVLDDLCDELATHSSDVLPGVASRAVAWFHDVGRPLPARLAGDAAHAALVALDTDRAVELAAGAAATSWRAAFVLAEAARSRGDGAVAAGWYAAAATLAPDDAAIRRVAMAQANAHAFQLGDASGAVRLLRAAADRISAPTQSLELVCEAAFLATLLGQFDDAIDTCRTVLASPGIDDLTTWTAAINLGYAQVMLGDARNLEVALDRAATVFDRVRREHPEGSDLYEALCTGADVLAGDVAAAILNGGERLRAMRDQPAHRGVTAAVTVEALLLAGDAAAIEVAAEAVAQLSAFDPFNALPFGLGYAALVQAFTGNSDGASWLVDEIVLDDLDVRSHAVVGRAEAAIAAHHGDFERAAALTLAAGQRAAVGSHFSLAAFAFVDSLRYGGGVEAASALAEAGTRSNAVITDVMSALGSAVMRSDPHAVDAAAAALRHHGALFVAEIGFGIAASLHRRPVDARRSLARAGALRCEMTLRAPGPPSAAVGGELTERETEVALLASQGLSNREIAERLYLSVRTVGNHLQHAYGKLELPGREALRELLLD